MKIEIVIQDCTKDKCVKVMEAASLILRNEEVADCIKVIALQGDVLEVVMIDGAEDYEWHLVRCARDGVQPLIDFDIQVVA